MNSKQREALYDRCRGDKEFPDCNLCGLPIRPGQRWHESHLPVPKWLKGRETGVAHKRCNELHNNREITPMAAKCKRVRRKHIGAEVPGMGKRAMPCGRSSPRRKKLNGQIDIRLNLRQKLERLGLVEPLPCC